MDEKEPQRPRRSQRREREERMRFEVLQMLHQAWREEPDRAAIQAYSFAADLGVWHAELFRVIEFLDRKGFVTYLGAGPLVRITSEGIRYMEEEAKGRRSIRD